MTDVSYMEALERLIAFPTVSADSNLALIEWVRTYLADHDVKSHLTFDDARGKANLFATIGEGDGGLVLSGHTDVVPVTGQDWSTDPFQASTRNGRIYGRGTCDMKGFIAVVLSLVPEMRRNIGRRPVHLAFSYDEEVGCIGAHRLIDDITRRGIRPRGCIVGEPTEMRVIVGQKGAGMYAYSVAGRAVHSSLAPSGVNAIDYAARIILRFREIAERLRAQEVRHDGYDVPYSTIQVNRIGGGVAGNIVADRCDFTVDIRHLPGTDRALLVADVGRYIDADLLPEMRAVASEASITWRETGDVPGFEIPVDAPLVRDVRRSNSVEGSCGHVAFGSEAGLFQRAGIPTLICGPGSIEQAHKPDEFVTLDQLARCERMLRDVLSSSPDHLLPQRHS